MVDFTYDDIGEDAESSPATSFVYAFNAALVEADFSAFCTMVVRDLDDDTVELYQITVDRLGDRRKGFANQAMELITSMADDFHIYLELEPAANMDAHGLDTEQLRRWYDGWGFDPACFGKMLRKPGA